MKIFYCPTDIQKVQITLQVGDVEEPYQKVALEIKDKESTAIMLDTKTDSMFDISRNLNIKGPGREDICHNDIKIPKIPIIIRFAGIAPKEKDIKDNKE